MNGHSFRWQHNKCPSDPIAGQTFAATDRGVTSCMSCTGDWRPSPGYEQNNHRGAFVARTIVVRSWNDIVDGTSNTIAASEHPVGMGDNNVGQSRDHQPWHWFLCRMVKAIYSTKYCVFRQITVGQYYTLAH
jgi:hypothetical protein